MYQPNCPVDELAKLRAKIAELRARETTLEARFIELSNHSTFTGFSGNVVVSHSIHDVFDISKLPETILNDPAFYARHQVTSVRIEPHDDIDSQSWIAGIGKPAASNMIEHR
ncbi:DUF4315 family protein [Pacificibacter marinus]|uniref:DUF4315 family protein n=1 Tax=Pacificibacter marinus TaxID=658057 RepID=UPI001C07EDD5|nr:DUF4315 family protein [Pacificibacter marinus]MBU2868656.1 DUF4315 family protein [Pacificibacter marinus]